MQKPIETLANQIFEITFIGLKIAFNRTKDYSEFIKMDLSILNEPFVYFSFSNVFCFLEESIHVDIEINQIDEEGKIIFIFHSCCTRFGSCIFNVDIPVNSELIPAGCLFIFSDDVLV